MKTARLSLSLPLLLTLFVGVALGDNGVDRVSVSSGGVGGNNYSNTPGLNSHGRYVVFTSAASNLVPNDTNGTEDVFVHDRQTGMTRRVSVATGGTQANSHSFTSVISANGRYVAFTSAASNLVGGDTNGDSDVFRHDLVTGTTIRVSITSSEAQAGGSSSQPSISGDGRYVAFSSDAPNLHVLGSAGTTQVYVRDVVAGTTKLCSVGEFLAPGNAASASPSVSADGTAVVFESDASNLTTVDVATVDVYRYDIVSGGVALVSAGFGGAAQNGDSYAPDVSADGNRVAFTSRATNLNAGGTLGRNQIFVRDMTSGVTETVSISSNGARADNHSTNPSISADGMRIAFSSVASNLLSSPTTDTNQFVHDMRTRTTVRVNLTYFGLHASTSAPILSGNGEQIAFYSSETVFAAGDANGTHDVFVRGYGSILRNSLPNPRSYSASRPVLGETWRAIVDLTTTGHSLATVIGTTAPTTAMLGGGQKVLVGGQKLFQLPIHNAPLPAWTSVLPNNVNLLGRSVYTQALHFGGVTPFALSNAQDICIGY